MTWLLTFWYQLLARFAAWLEHLGEAGEDLTEDDPDRSEPLVDTHGEWTIRIFDDQPIAEGRKSAADRRVVVERNGEAVGSFLYPSYRIWTLLAHWTDALPLVVEANVSCARCGRKILPGGSLCCGTPRTDDDLEQAAGQ